MSRFAAQPPLKPALVYLGLVILGGCVTYRPVVVAPKTSLENDILGGLQRLHEDLPLVTRPTTTDRLPPERRRVLQALIDQQLAQSEIDRLKSQGLVGEGRDGLLRALASPADPPVARTIEAENQRRLTIMRGVIDSTSTLSERDLPAVQRCYHRYQADRAKAGETDVTGAR